MKITKVAVAVLRVPVEVPYTAGGRTVDANWHVVARLITSDGVEGIGYVVYPRPELMTTIGQAARELGEHLIGMSVLEPEAAWERLARRGDWVGPGGLLHTADAFRRLLEARAVDVVILDLARVGGITPWRKIAALAEAHRVPVCGHVVPEIQVHLLSAVPNGHLVEYVPRSAGILTAMPRIENGELVAPDRPGLGLELDETAVRRYEIT